MTGMTKSSKPHGKMTAQIAKQAIRKQSEAELVRACFGLRWLLSKLHVVRFSNSSCINLDLFARYGSPQK
jgi:hypothetical protein